MLKRLLVFMTALLPVLASWGAEPDTISVRRAFVDMPLSTLDLLSRSTRLDMLDFYDLDSIYNARNTMAGISRLEKLEPGYLKVKLTPVTTMELKILPSGNKGAQLVLLNYTIGDSIQAKDSDLKFFDSSMNELPGDKFMKLPELSDFFDYPDKKVKEEVSRLVPFPTVEYTVVPESGDLVARLTVGEFMSSEDFKSIKPYLKPSIVYNWNGNRYRKAK